jgi:hypothetical protein
MSRLHVVATVTLTLLMIPAAAAGANIYSRVLRAYETNGSVPPCQFSSQQLQTALKGIDTYGAQYFADFTTAVQNALAARASGACAPARAQAVAAGESRARASSVPLKLRPLTAATGASVPAPILLMAVFAAVTAILGGLWWRLSRNPRAEGEPGYRAAADGNDWPG